MKNLKATEIRNKIVNGELKAIEVAEYFLKRAKKLNEKLNLFITLNEEDIIEQAKRIDRKIEKNEKLGKLAGIPIGIKDNIITKNIRTTCGSKMLENYIPPYDATVIEKIKEEDGIIFGKTNMDEFAMGSSNEHSYFGFVKNPHDMERVPGGSSGGSAAGVSAKVFPIALGSDTGGSIRQPAAFCGITGFKPTYGRVSRFGLIAFASSMDQIGPMGRNVEDVAHLYNTINGHDKRDSTSLEGREYVTIKETKEKYKIAFLNSSKIATVNEEYLKREEELKKFLEKEGHNIIDVEIPELEYVVAVYYILAPSEASSNLSRFDGVRYGYRTEKYSSMEEFYKKTRGEGFGEEVKRRIMMGTFCLSAGYYDAYYNKALKIRYFLKKKFSELFKEVDFLINPTTPTTAYKIGEKISNPLEMYLSDIFTITANLIGSPAISIPIGFDGKNLPMGMHILADEKKDAMLLNFTSSLEKIIDFKGEPKIE